MSTKGQTPRQRSANDLRFRQQYALSSSGNPPTRDGNKGVPAASPARLWFIRGKDMVSVTVFFIRRLLFKEGLFGLSRDRQTDPPATPARSRSIRESTPANSSHDR